jgi:hypothetical protein
MGFVKDLTFKQLNKLVYGVKRFLKRMQTVSKKLIVKYFNCIGVVEG